MNKLSRPAVIKKATEEFKEFAIIAAYLYVFFAALIYLKAAILQAHGIAYAHFGLAAAKALICAKFVLVGQALKLGERHKNRPLVVPILYKAAIFIVFLMVLDTLEEIVVGLIHHRPVAQSIGEVAGGTLPQFLATSFICLLMLVPFFAFKALGEVVGEDNLLRLFFGGHRSDKP